MFYPGYHRLLSVDQGWGGEGRRRGASGGGGADLTLSMQTHCSSLGYQNYLHLPEHLELLL